MRKTITKLEKIVNIGIIEYLSEHKNEGYIRVISTENYSEKITFIPTDIDFEIVLYKLLVIDERNNTKKYFEFNLNNHSQLIDLKLLKDQNQTISIDANGKFAKFIIDNELYRNSSPELRKLRGISKLIKYRSGYPPNTVQMNNIEELIDKYELKYSEGGRDKPGDWSRAWIDVSTSRPSNLPDYYLDNYLSKLLPKFDFKLGEGEDCMEYRFKSDIVRKMRNEIGIENIEKINKLCSELTDNIKQFAKLLYRENEHALSLWYEYGKLYSDILKKYSE